MDSKDMLFILLIAMSCFKGLHGQQNFSSMCVSVPHGRNGSPKKDGAVGPVGPPGLSGPPGIQGTQGPPGSMGGGMYIRWGRSFCSNTTGIETVYTGYAGNTGSNGEGTNYLFMPGYPEYSTSLNYRSGYKALGIQGVEYYFPTKTNANRHNAPCAVCHVSTRATVLMTPANFTWPPSWTREYYRYLMTDSDNHANFVCVDKVLESLPGSAGEQVSGRFAHTEGHCSSLPCPPYVDHKELNCVVCTK